MTDYQKYINALRKCAKEHENCRTSTGHIIVSDLCRDTANLLETLEQEPILDKIRTEIDKQKKWLLQAGYTAYNLDIALDAIKAVVAGK
jgi:hypothetical protein